MSGNAWEDYEPAILSVKPLPHPLGAVWDVLTNNPKADRSKAEALLAAHATALQGLRQGVQKSIVRRRVPWGSPSQLWPAGHLRNLGACQARFLAEAGKSREAAELLLDVCQFAGDCSRTGSFTDAWIGHCYVDSTLEELKPIIASGRLSAEDLLELTRELDVFDRSLPELGLAYANEALDTGSRMVNAGTVDAYLAAFEIRDPKLSTWRYGFSERILLADAFEVTRSSMDAKREGDRKPWGEARKVHAAVDRDLAENRNPLIRLLHASLDSGAQQAPAIPRVMFREVRAHLRLLRMAALFRARGEIQPLEDPFGAKLLFSKVENRLRIWSVGLDGVDDGGTGEWLPKGKDIVLEVER
jgi:hypothetical protein